MKAARIALRILVFTAATHGVDEQQDSVMQYWPQWRGPLSTGESPLGTPPVSWSEEENVVWKTKLPGSGHSSPIVWANKVFLTAVQPKGKNLPVPEQPKGAHNNLDPTHKLSFLVLCMDMSEGRILWQREVRLAQPHQSTHETGTWASASPVTDGERVYAFFGSNGLYCLDYNGTLLWEKDFGDMEVKHGHGEGASPALGEEVLVINWDHEGDSFVVAMDSKKGKELWRQPRDEPTSWASPIIAEVDGGNQVIVSGTKAVRGYELKSGKVVWSCGGLSNNVVASPVYSDGRLYAGSSYEKQAMLALDLSKAKGQLEGTDHVIWTRSRRTPYVPSPLLYGKHLYFLRHYQAILCRLAADSGTEPTGPFRLPGLLNLYASPVAANGRIYLVDQQGSTLVLSNKATPEPLSINRLKDSFNASPAIAGNSILLRGAQYLYRLAEPE